MLGVLFGTSAGAIWVEAEIAEVPIERLVANLERRAAENPRDAAVRINLARLHGMAYARKSDTAQVRRGDENQPWYGFEPKPIPYEPKPAATPGEKAAADDHLRESVRWYEEALSLEPENLTAQLGHAWSLEQQGRTDGAIAEYRALIEQAWAKERTVTRGKLGQRFYTTEAASYLIPLLDTVKDREEIAELERRVAQLRRVPRPVTPLAIALDDSLAPSHVPSSETVFFDGDGSGLQRSWTWISPRAAWLVRDPGHGRPIDSALRLFGNVSFWLFWRDGFEALGSLDDDGDGEVRDGELESLALWQDVNSSGTSDPGEVTLLSDHGIVALSYRTVSRCEGPWLTGVAAGAVRFADGRRRDLVDVVIHPADPPQ